MKKFKKGIQLSEAFPEVLVVVLVAVLVIIALYIFTTLSTSFPLATVSVVNESGRINNTAYTLSNASACGFASPSITGAFNETSGLAIASGNWTVTSAGVVTNASAINWDKALISYSYSWRGNACTAANTTITQFAAYPALIGLVGTIIFLALVIGVLVASFAFGGKKGV